MVDTADARPEKKTPLPLELRERLSSNELDSLEAEFYDHAGTRLLTSLSAGERVAERLQDLRQRRYRATYYFTGYGEPRLVFRLDKGRREWIAGVAVAWLVLHDLDSGTALCQTRLIAQNDTRELSTSSRRRAALRQKLIVELAEKLSTQATATFRTVTGELELPDATPGEEVTQKGIGQAR